jgi:hypothetical protein
MTVIDLTEKIDDICERHGDRYWAADEAHQEMLAHWGNPAANDCGVFEVPDDPDIRINGPKHWYGEIRIALSPNGWHGVAVSWWYGLGGGGSYPSIWSYTAYTERDEAVAAGIAKLIGHFESIRDQTGSAPASQPADAERMITALEAYTAQTRQMTLF